MKFVKPFALITIENIENGEEKFDALQNEDADARIFIDEYEYPREVENISKLPSYTLTEYYDYEERNIPNFYAIPFQIDTGYSLANKTHGGEYYIKLIRKLLNILPKRNCSSSEDYCSVILEAKHKERNMYVYCAIVNTEIGVGIPFNCEVIAFEGKAGWYVLSHLGPEECNGCGAISGAHCFIATDSSIDYVSTIFKKVVRESKIGLSLREFGDKNIGINLIGQSKGKNSKFFSGYYEKSYASYNINVTNDDPGGRKVIISFLYNLLISAEPATINDTHYHDIKSDDSETSSIEWLQKKVAEIYQISLSKELGSVVECEVYPIY